jgi:hypothetical protein
VSDARSNPFTPRAGGGSAARAREGQRRVEWWAGFFSLSWRVRYAPPNLTETNDDEVEDDIDDEGMMSSPDTHTLKNCFMERGSGYGSVSDPGLLLSLAYLGGWCGSAASEDPGVRVCSPDALRSARPAQRERAGVVLPSRPPRVSRRGGAVSPAVRERRWATKKNRTTHGRR